MACLITKGKLLGCKDQRGGIKNLYLANFAEYGYTIAAQVLTDLGDLTEVFKYEVKATTNALTETGTVSEDNGTFLNAQSLAVTLPKLGADLQAQIQLICAGRPQVFVEDYNGNIMLNWVNQRHNVKLRKTNRRCRRRFIRISTYHRC
jgi:hypothetical protein